MGKTADLWYHLLPNISGVTGDPGKSGSAGGGGLSMKVVIAGFFPEAGKDSIRGSFPCDWDVRIVLPEEAEQELTDADVLIPEHILSRS